jgi:hypothetical protein
MLAVKSLMLHEDNTLPSMYTPPSALMAPLPRLSPPTSLAEVWVMFKVVIALTSFAMIVIVGLSV